MRRDTKFKLGDLFDSYLSSNIANKLVSDKLKGGNNKMETKSRYEVIAELEEKKRSLILERDSFDFKLKNKQKELKELKRDLEDKEEEIKEFEDSIEEQKQTISELINSVDESLKRFTELQGKKS